MHFYLHDELKTHFTASEPLFDQIMCLKGEKFRFQDGRLTQRIHLGQKTYFIKQHYGVGWKEIIKNLLQLRLPIISATNEYLALQKLAQIGVCVPKVMGYGVRGVNPSRRQSFIIMEELLATTSLEDVCKPWSLRKPDFVTKKNLIEKVATIAKLLHQHGMNHRDFYICHFLLSQLDKKNQKLYLIDLHRAQIRRITPNRWIKKDLCALYFSSKDINFTRNDFYRFMKIYRSQPLHNIIRNENNFWREIKSRGEKMYRDHNQ